VLIADNRLCVSWSARSEDSDLALLACYMLSPKQSLSRNTFQRGSVLPMDNTSAARPRDE